MRAFLNAWLRRWAEASLRTELHQAQERLIRQQNISENLISESQRLAGVNKQKLKTQARKHKKNVAHSEHLIKALRDRMPEDLFLAVAEHVHAMEAKAMSKEV